MARLKESVELRYAPAAQKEEEVEKLDHPWIGDEGAVDADFRRSKTLPELRPRGLAFDDETTVVWDEDECQTITARSSESDVVALHSEVLVRERFKGPKPLYRIDYLRGGVLLASRYTTATRGGNHA